MFQIEPRVPVRLFLDTSSSMSATSEEKSDAARWPRRCVTSAGGWIRFHSALLRNLGDRFICGGGGTVSPRHGILAHLIGGHTSFYETVRQFISTYSQRGLLIVVSDFLDDNGCEKALQYLTDFGHELLLVQVWSEEDRRPPWNGELELVDSESGSRVKMQIDERARERYTAAFDRYAETLQKIAVSNNGRYVSVSTATPLEDVIFGTLVRAKGLV
jgi:hypothetical protein